MRKPSPFSKAHLRQKLLLFALLAVAAVLFASCTRTGSELLSYRLQPFTAKARGRLSLPNGERVEFSATVTLGERVEEGERELEVVFHSPDSLGGLSFCRERDGGVTLRLGEIECRLQSGEAVGRIIKIAGMLEAEEEILSISSIPGSEVGMTQYERLTLIKMSGHSLLIDPSTEDPVKALSDDGEVEIYLDSFSRGR